MARSTAAVRPSASGAQSPKLPKRKASTRSDAAKPAVSEILPSLPKSTVPADGAARPRERLREHLRKRPAAVDLELPVDGEIAVDGERRRGRGALSNASGRFEPVARIGFDDGWQIAEEMPAFRTTVTIDSTRKIITHNDSPDISFDRSINPYRGCEHGCIYCFARPTHAYLGLSPGLDFESKLFAKPEAAKLLERELSAPGYVPRVIAIGTNTDPYQPIEREHQIMRRILEVLDRFGHPVGIVTKSALVLRDLDILSRMAKRNLVKVALSVTALDPKLARTMEPRAATPRRRLDALRDLTAAGVPSSVMVAPIIPALNDSEIERILDTAAALGVKEAGYVLLRLPLEVRDLFREWLVANFPDRYRHVFKLIRETRDGKDYDSSFGKRMTGGGPVAWMIGRRFELACAKLGFNKSRTRLSCEHFVPPQRGPEQLSLL
ncbi:MAG: PA0069 family radical SAM protein [Hyphomicrobiales bacterium]|nr:PA0069 family radical SAM protein [Hyphomicrobiales bacterium]